MTDFKSRYAVVERGKLKHLIDELVICDDLDTDVENALQAFRISDPLLTERVAEVIEAARTIEFNADGDMPTPVVVNLRNAIAALDALTAGEKRE